MAVYRRICSWCGVHLSGPPDAPVSHGVCAACKKRLLPEFLDTLPAPAFLLSPAGAVVSANAAALARVGKDLAGVEGLSLEQALGGLCGCVSSRPVKDGVLVTLGAQPCLKSS